jgi:hypothetical protein
MKAGVERVVIIFFLLRIYFQMRFLANFQGDIKLQAKVGVVSTFPHPRFYIPLPGGIYFPPPGGVKENH